MGKNRYYNNQNNYKQEQRPEVMAAPIEEEVVDAVETEVSEETASKTQGVVVDCTKLRVRKESDDTADVLCLLEVSAEVQVDLEASTSDFFKVTTESGVEGYCMKKFIAVV